MALSPFTDLNKALSPRSHGKRLQVVRAQERWRTFGRSVRLTSDDVETESPPFGQSGVSISPMWTAFYQILDQCDEERPLLTQCFQSYSEVGKNWKFWPTSGESSRNESALFPLIKQCHTGSWRQQLCMIIWSLFLSCRPDSNNSSAGNVHNNRRGCSTDTSAHRWQSDDKTSQTPLCWKHSLRSDRGEVWSCSLTSCLHR